MVRGVVLILAAALLATVCLAQDDTKTQKDVSTSVAKRTADMLTAFLDVSVVPAACVTLWPPSLCVFIAFAYSCSPYTTPPAAGPA